MGDAYRPDSPLPPEQSGIADYAESFRSAREAADVNVTLPFRGQQLTMARDMIEHQMGQVEWLSYCPQQRMRLTEERVVSIPYPQGDCQALAKELAYLLDNPECIEQRSRSATRLGAGSSWRHNFTRCSANYWKRGQHDD